MLTGIGIALMVAMMGGMMLIGHKKAGGGHEKHAKSEASASRGPVEVSSAPVQGAEAGSDSHQH